MEAILGIMSLPVLMGILACIAFAEYIYARKHGVGIPFLGEGGQETTIPEPSSRIPEPVRAPDPPVHVTFVVNKPQTIVMPPTGDDSGWATPVQTAIPRPAPVPPMLPSPSPRFASVTFKESSKQYDYFIGDIPDLRVGDRVIVYTRRGKIRRRMATVQRISTGYEKSEHARSHIALKIRGKYMASPRGQRYHLPWCMEMDGVEDKEARWFQSDADARRYGLSPCRKCI